MGNNAIRRGDVFFANLSYRGEESEQTGIRPVIIIQNDVGNKYSNNTIVIPLTCKAKKGLPTHVYLDATRCGLLKDSTALCEQIISISKTRLSFYISHLDDEIMEEVDSAVLVSCGLGTRLAVPA